MKVNGKYRKDTASALRRQAIRLLSDEKLAAIKHYKDHLNKAVCIHNTLDLLMKVAERERRNRKRRHLSSTSREQLDKPKKRREVDNAAQEAKTITKPSNI